jgi:hypothetical protein
VEGHHPGLTEKWRHGVADLSAGLVDLGWAVVEVTSVDQCSVRDPTAREAWSVSPRCKLVRVKSRGADLEWAVPEEQFAWAMSEVMDSPT